MSRVWKSAWSVRALRRATMAGVSRERARRVPDAGREACVHADDGGTGKRDVRLLLLFVVFEGAGDLFDLLPDANELLAVAVHVRDHLIEVDAKLLHPEQAEFERLFLLLDVLDLHGRSVTRRPRLSPRQLYRAPWS